MKNRYMDSDNQAEDSKGLPQTSRNLVLPTLIVTSYGSTSNLTESSPLLESHQSGNDRLSISKDDGNISSSQTSVIGDDEVPDKIEWKWYLNIAKVAVLVSIVMFCLVVLMFIPEKKNGFLSIAVERDTPVYLDLPKDFEAYAPILSLNAVSFFLPENYLNLSKYHVWFTIIHTNLNGTEVTLRLPWVAPIAPTENALEIGLSELKHTFQFTPEEVSDSVHYKLKVTTDEDEPVSITLSIAALPTLSLDSIIMASCVLCGLYVLIIFDMVHRTLAAMLGATLAVGFLALIRDRPTLEKIISWLDIETLCLLFGMMVLVAILCETGYFDYLAVVAYRLARGRIWMLIIILCLFTAIVSAFLDNVTTILLMTPVTIRLCEVMNLDPKNILITLVIFSNIGGAATPVGDPPNVIIVSNQRIQDGGINFTNFTLHAAPGILFCILGTFIFIWLRYRDISSLRFTEPPEVVELKHEIDVWKKACNSLPGYSRDETTVRNILNKKVKVLKRLLKRHLYDVRPTDEDYKASLEELSSKYKIRNMPLFIKTAIVLSAVIILFFLQSFPNLNLSLGWIAIIGAILLLVVADIEDVESIMARVEWSTLIFFAALFVVMEAVTELQLLPYIGDLTESWIMAVSKDYRLLVSILLIVWVSALASSFIDNIPFTTVMVKIVTNLADNQELGLPIMPLVFALAFGACLGGNGTLIGASANVVCAGVAEQHGYRFTFMDFFKIGFPVMLLTTTISSIYLIICHVVLDWNYS